MNVEGSTLDIKDDVIIKNHPIYWFDDGSLFLDVETQRFKVHHTLITRHSKFLSSISDSQTDQTSERTRIGKGLGRIGSVSLSHVVLEPKRQVKPEDMEALLQHLYHDVSVGLRKWVYTPDADHIIRRLDKDTSFSHIVSLLRISSPRQLDFPNIHLAAREMFEASFPRNPEDFTHKHPLYDALPVAQEFNISLATKAIFYTLVSTTDFDVSAAPSIADPQQESPATSHSSPDLNLDKLGSEQTFPEKSLAPRVLSPNDAQICLALMNRLIAHFTPILFTPPATSHMECTDVFADTWMTLVIQPAIEDDGVYRPLETLQKIKELDWVKRGLCTSCFAEKVEEWSEEQRSIWYLMDEWLELPSQLPESSS